MSLKILTLLLFVSTGIHAAPSAKEILKKVEQRNQGNDFQSKVEMTIQRGSSPKSRELMWWGYRNGPKDYLLMKYLKPNSLKGSGLLIKSESSSQTDQWIYLSRAAKKDPRRVASSDKGKPFMGSDYSYIDFEKFRADKFNGKVLKSAGAKVTLELLPREADFPYSRIITTIDTSNYVPLESEFFIKAGGVKKYRVVEIKKISGIWTVIRSEMVNAGEGSTSKILVKSIEYNKSLKPSLFNKSSLKR